MQIIQVTIREAYHVKSTVTWNAQRSTFMISSANFSAAAMTTPAYQGAMLMLVKDKRQMIDSRYDPTPILGRWMHRKRVGR